MERNTYTAKPDLSIVIVSFNTIDLTRACLHSIEQNRRKLNLQIIVVDNNSQDGSPEMIHSEFPYVLLIENDNNTGFATANNQGFSSAESDYILLLNSDTVVYGDVLDKSVSFIQTRRDVGAMACQVLNRDGSIQMTCSGYPTLTRLLLQALALDRLPGFSILDTYQMSSWNRENETEVEVISGCYLLVRQEIVDQLGGLDEDFFFFGEETDWCKRIREAGWKLVFSPVGQIMHYGGGSVKKLNHQRDVMLTSALVRLHRKHGGYWCGIVAYLILLFFNISRGIGWAVLSIIYPSKRARAQHFRRVAFPLKQCWPE